MGPRTTTSQGTLTLEFSAGTYSPQDPPFQAIFLSSGDPPFQAGDPPFQALFQLQRHHLCFLGEKKISSPIIADFYLISAPETQISAKICSGDPSFISSGNTSFENLCTLGPLSGLCISWHRCCNYWQRIFKWMKGNELSERFHQI